MGQPGGQLGKPAQCEPNGQRPDQIDLEQLVAQLSAFAQLQNFDLPGAFIACHDGGVAQPAEVITTVDEDRA